MNKKQIYIFIWAFLFAAVVQGFSYFEVGISDGIFWDQQAKFFQINDPQQFNPNFAYGHPGGPIILGTIALHQILNIDYDAALLVFLGLFNGLIIAIITVFCSVLRKENLWWLVVLGTLSFDRLYRYATPPSAVVSIIIVLLCLLTLWIYEKKEDIKMKDLGYWGLISGLAISTRADIGFVSTIFFLALLKLKMGWINIFKMVIFSFLTFAVFDPYMWFMPIDSMGDLISKVLYHYEEFAPTPLKLSVVLSVSSLAFISILVVVAVYFQKYKKEMQLPPLFSLTLLVMTAFLYTTFLTSKYQAVRYFLPIIFIWQTFLPLYILSIIQDLKFDFLKTNQGQVVFNFHLLSDCFNGCLPSLFSI